MPKDEDEARAAAGTEAEAEAVRRRYARRTPGDARYSLLNPAAMLAWQERQRALLRLFRRLGWHDLADKALLEIGSGSGGNLVDFLRMGFAPGHLAGIELLAERHAAARRSLPAAVRLELGDALALLAAPRDGATSRSAAAGRFDIVHQATVFSSLLDDAFQQRLAEAMWAAVKPGGGVLWYDFTVDNPRNADVRGVPLARVRALFPAGRLRHERLTLAPPLARRATALHPALYTLLNTIPWLRTHLLCWIQKPL